MRHWLLLLNSAIFAFVAGAFAAPILAMTGLQQAAQPLYAVYHLACHQWAFRSFFLFGAQPIYGREELAASGRDPFSFVGDATLGWKMAFCERDLAIYVGLLIVGIVFAWRRDLHPLGFLAYAVLAMPLALDGFTQLFGWRESNWELRVITGLIFGLASAWLVYPRFDLAMGVSPTRARYAPQTAEPVCAAVKAASPHG